MSVKLFWRDGCPRCPEAKRLGAALEQAGVEVKCYDIDTVDGLAESCLYEVMALPTLVAADDQGGEIHSWRGTVPRLEEVQAYLK